MGEGCAVLGDVITSSIVLVMACYSSRTNYELQVTSVQRRSRLFIRSLPYLKHRELNRFTAAAPAYPGGPSRFAPRAIAEQIDDGASGSGGSGDDREERISIRAPVSVDYDYEDEDEFAEEAESRGSGSRGMLNPSRRRSGRGEQAGARRSPLGGGGDDEEEERISIRAPLSVDDWNGDEDEEDEEGEEERVSIRAPISMDDDGDDDDDDDRSTANTETTGAGAKKPPSIHAPLSVEGDDEEDDDTWLKRLRARTKGSGTRSTTGGGSSTGRRRTRRPSGEFDRRSRLSAEVYGGKKVGRSKRKGSIGGDLPGFGFGPGGVLGVGDLTVPRARITSDAEDFSAPPAVSGDAEDGESEEESGISSAGPRSPLVGGGRGNLDANSRGYEAAAGSAETSGADGRAEAGEGQPVAEAEVWQLVADVMTRKEQEKVRGREARGDRGGGGESGAERDKLAAAMADGAGKARETPTETSLEGSVEGAETLKGTVVDDASVQMAGDESASRLATAGSAATAAAAGEGGAAGGGSSAGAVSMTVWANENGSEANSRSVVTNSTGATEGGSECSTAEEIAHLHADLGWTEDEGAKRGEREQGTREGREAVRRGGEVANAGEGGEESGEGGGELEPFEDASAAAMLLVGGPESLAGAGGGAAAAAAAAQGFSDSSSYTSAGDSFSFAAPTPTAASATVVAVAAGAGPAAAATGASGSATAGKGPASGVKNRPPPVKLTPRLATAAAAAGARDASPGGGSTPNSARAEAWRGAWSRPLALAVAPVRGAANDSSAVTVGRGGGGGGGGGGGVRGSGAAGRSVVARGRREGVLWLSRHRRIRSGEGVGGAGKGGARDGGEGGGKGRSVAAAAEAGVTRSDESGAQPRTHPLVAQTLYRLELAERMSARGRAGAEAGAGGRGTAGGAAGGGGGAGGDGMVGRRVREMVLEDAQARAGELEEESMGSGQLGLHVTVLVLGRRAVGKSATGGIQEVVGEVCGVGVRVLELPGLGTAGADMAVDRLDWEAGQGEPLEDLEMLSRVGAALGRDVWRSVVLVLTHATAATPTAAEARQMVLAKRREQRQQRQGRAPGERGGKREGERQGEGEGDGEGEVERQQVARAQQAVLGEVVARRAQYLQQCIRVAAGDQRLCNPVVVAENGLLSAAQMRRYRAELAAWEGRAERLLCKEQRRVRRQQAQLRQVHRAGGGGAAAAATASGGDSQQQQAQGQEQEQVVKQGWAVVGGARLREGSNNSSSGSGNGGGGNGRRERRERIAVATAEVELPPSFHSDWPAHHFRHVTRRGEVSAVFPLSLPPPWPVWEHAPPFNALLLDRCLAASSRLPAAVTAQGFGAISGYDDWGQSRGVREEQARGGGGGDAGGGAVGGIARVAGGEGGVGREREGGLLKALWRSFSRGPMDAAKSAAAAAAVRAGATRATAAAERGSDGASAARGRGAGESGTRASGGAASSSLHATSGARGAGGAASLELGAAAAAAAAAASAAAAAATCTVRSDVRVSLFRGNRTAAGVAVAMGSDYGDGIAAGAKLSSRVAVGRCVRVSGSAAAVRWGQEEAVGATCRLQRLHISHTEPQVREQVEMVITANDDVWLEGEVMQWEQQERSGMQKLRERRLAKIAAKAAAAGVIRTSAIRPPWAGGTLGRKIPSAAPWSPFSRNVSAAAARAARPSQLAPEPAVDEEPDFQDEWADVRASFDLTLAEYRKTLKTRSPKIGETPNPLKHFLPRLAADVDAAATDAQNLAVAPAAAVAGGATGLWDAPTHPGAAECEDCREAEQRATVAYLLNQRGYDACRRVTEWAYSRGIPSGEYEFVEVGVPPATGGAMSPAPQPTKPQQPRHQQQQTASAGKANSQDKPPVQQDQKQQVVIVDITFRAQFTLSRPTPEYQALWSAIPRVFVGTSATLRKLLALLIEAMRVCVASQSLHLPPWRRSQYMNSKWLAPSRRRGAAAPPAAASPFPSPSPSHAPAALCPMHQREAEAGDAWCGACSGSKSGAEAVTGGGGESGSGRPRRLRAAGATAAADHVGGSSSCGSALLLPAGSAFSAASAGHAEVNAALFMRQRSVAGARQNSAAAVSATNYRSPSNGSAFRGGATTSDVCGTAMSTMVTSSAIPIANHSSRVRKAGLLSLQLRASSVPEIGNGSMIQLGAQLATRPS
ncbi:unnamed protein product [Closterium sp. Yama58-4]|nr:unnamed protein product [Closterium sp. Yama58-4]